MVHRGKEVILSGTWEFHTENLSHIPWGHLQPLKASFGRGGGGVQKAKKVSYCDSLGQSDRKSWKVLLGA